MEEKILLILGFLEIIISVPFLFDKVQPNSYIGIRTKKTLSNKDLWYKANKRFATWFYLIGLFHIMSYFSLANAEMTQILEFALIPLVIVLFDLYFFLKKQK